MELNTPVPLKACDKPMGLMLEIRNAEKQLWSLIYSKGLLHNEAHELYVKVCSRYEKTILRDHEVVEFQEIEYSLWKLHYKHIYEYRKRISQSSTSIGCTESEINRPVEKYKFFLTEAAKYYENLISKTREFYGLDEDPLFEKKDGDSCDLVKLHKCQYSCHRFLVCLGDLARYGELCKNIDVQRRNWSVAATYYFKAASCWPDSGNPQNQLAVLAKYIGDDFLALYHCIRSLAVKEPFPDAWNNLILLLEENRSSQFESLTREAHFNFLNPSERSAPPSECDLKNNEMQATDHVSPGKKALWSLFVRLISLFFVDWSSEEFLYTFASTIRELEFLLGLNDNKLSSSLESYQHMDPNRTGPYRVLQLVSILILTIDSLTTSVDHKEYKENTNLKKPDLVKSALTATFTILGRVTERCTKDILVISKPLLPAVLVFVEWLVGKLDLVQKFVSQEEVACAVSYFLDTFAKLLNGFETQDELKHQKDISLWEDLELRGFSPMACSHKHLKFCTREKTTCEGFGGETRVHRIFDAAIKITEKSPNGFQNLFLYNIEKGKFFTIKQPRSVDLDFKEPQQTICEAIKEKEKITKIVAIEEEEEIIFKPLTRYNSAPIYSQDTEKSPESVKDKTILSDDSLRRATSLFAEQIQNFQSNTKTLESNHPMNKHEIMLNASATSYPAGPPSLNAWVIDKESIDKEKDKATKDFFKPRLSPIDEMGFFSLIDSPPYSAPIPSAPLLPDDAFLLCGNSPIHDMNSPMSITSNYKIKPVFYGQSSFTPMSSSEWLRQFRNQNLNRGNQLIQPIHCQTPGNLYRNEASTLSFINRQGFNKSNPNQIVYPEIPHLYAGSDIGFVNDGLRREELFHNYQKLNPYGYCDDVAGSRDEKSSLVQILKEKELQLQNQSQVRGPAAYMGN